MCQLFQLEAPETVKGPACFTESTAQCPLLFLGRCTFHKASHMHASLAAAVPAHLLHPFLADARALEGVEGLELWVIYKAFLDPERTKNSDPASNTVWYCILPSLKLEKQTTKSLEPDFLRHLHCLVCDCHIQSTHSWTVLSSPKRKKSSVSLWQDCQVGKDLPP